MQLLNIEDAAKMLNISIWTLRTWLSQRRLSYIKVGRLTKIKKETLEKFIEANTVHQKSRGN